MATYFDVWHNEEKAVKLSSCLFVVWAVGSSCSFEEALSSCLELKLCAKVETEVTTFLRSSCYVVFPWFPTVLYHTSFSFSIQTNCNLKSSAIIPATVKGFAAGHALGSWTGS